jgi:regulator of sigma E protease
MDIIWTYILPFLGILTALVFVHELGHYSVARWAGVKVEVFSIGFGPEIFGWTAASGTRWKFSAIPLGGYVKMFGDADPASTRGDGLEGMSEAERALAFHHKPLRDRALIIAAGPAANFVFAIVLLTAMFISAGQPYAPAVLDKVLPDSAAAAAGLQVNDRVIELDGVTITKFEDMRRLIMDNPGVSLAMTIERAGSQLDLTIVPQVSERVDRFGNSHRIGLLGVNSQRVETVRLGPVAAVGAAVNETYSLVTRTLASLGQIITGSRTVEELGGPLRIAQMSGAVAQTGWLQTVWFMAILSVNLGLINLFPIPVLDGGHLLFHAVEATLGRPVGEKVMEFANLTGLTMVLGLMVFVTWNDLTQMRVFEYLGSFFG